MPAERSHTIDFSMDENLGNETVGVLVFLSIIKEYGIDDVIKNSLYPETKDLPKLNSILAFLALKLVKNARYSNDSMWAHNRILGMFAGLNVLPKSTWFSTYSSATTRDQNITFIKAINAVFKKHGLLSGVFNIDFTAIPYYGNSKTLENNWAGKYDKCLQSFQASICQDSGSGLLCYGDATIRHENQNEVILDFVEIYQSDGLKLDFMIFDSKFTTIKNLGNMDRQGVKFITIQRRCKTVITKIDAIPKDEWKTVRIQKANDRDRIVRYAESTTTLQSYGDGDVRQIFIETKHEKPAIIITNDKERPVTDIVRKYSLRWSVENKISEQINFFHLNRNCSEIDIKVDFDLTMSMLANNLYRLLALKLKGYERKRPEELYENFITGKGVVQIKNDEIEVIINRRKRLPVLLTYMKNNNLKYDWIGNKSLKFIPNSN
jgi:hypothetical protein